MAPNRSSFVVNHRVALVGSKAIAAIGDHRVEYIAIRPGAVKELTLQDEMLAEQSRQLGLAGYLDKRPGAVAVDGTALFSQNGPVALVDARKALEQNKGAVCTTVITVRREDAEALGLTDRASWERFVRQNWQHAFAQMTDIPENRVAYIAALHVNQPNNIHVHIFSWDTDAVQPWNALLAKNKMERARKELTDVAMKRPLLKLSKERTLTRDKAVAAMRKADPEKLNAAVELPETGSLDYGHLKRYHPEIRHRLDEAVKREVERSPQIKEAYEQHMHAVERSAELKGLEGHELEVYIASAKRELDRRLANAALHAMRPDRGPRQEDAVEARAEEETYSPSSARKREDSLAEEMDSCLTDDEKQRLFVALASCEPIPEELLRKCPTLDQATKQSGDAPSALSGMAIHSNEMARLAARALKSCGKSSPNAADAVVRQAMRMAAWLALRAISNLGVRVVVSHMLARDNGASLEM